ncbi:MAG: cren protein [Thermoproteota archaeon]
MTQEVGEKLIPVRVGSLRDLARMAATIVSLGQPAYLIKFSSSRGKKVYGIIAVLRDYYKLYGLPMLYYYEDEGDLEGSYLLVKVDDQTEQVEVGKSTRPGWIAIPIVELAEKPPFFPDEL